MNIEATSLVINQAEAATAATETAAAASQEVMEQAEVDTRFQEIVEQIETVPTAEKRKSHLKPSKRGVEQWMVANEGFGRI